MATSPAPVSIDLIRDRKIVESQAYEFKSFVDFDDARAKANFIDDVVAFLNAGPGHIIIGVHAKKGVPDRFVPLNGDRDDIILKVTSIIQDNIQPKPLGISVQCLDVEAGFVLDVIIPEHLMRPYQNKIAPGFYIRTGAKNTPVPPDQLYALFKSQEEREKSTVELMEREGAAIKALGIAVLNSSTLHIAIVPQEHYERDFPSFDPGKAVLKTMRPYYGGAEVFRGCERGFEVSARDSKQKLMSRFFIGDDWLIHSWAAYAITLDAGDRLKLPEFRAELVRHLKDIQLILEDSQIRGPFTILLALRNLRDDPKLKFFFPLADSALMARPVRIERVDDENLIERFYDKVRSVSVYGR